MKNGFVVRLVVSDGFDVTTFDSERFKSKELAAAWLDGDGDLWVESSSFDFKRLGYEIDQVSVVELDRMAMIGAGK
ncbi:hypothetical protein UFOVP1313_44 [uncultured Caudovirales phage]|uniref:Uncharacterized protein n=1 Tax=uncultured Caudovirales phage TaxID=2100421 RepID=A0A6J5RKS9_9CAUD|nr:hypothetical protein UFOVP1313_44 [uncultured Caudovirales phage]